MLTTQAQCLHVGADNFIVAFAAPGEALFHELFQVFVGHIHQMGQGPHDDHVGGTVIAGGAGQFFDREAEGSGVALQLELGGVEDDDAVFPHVGDVAVVGLLVECDQNVDIVAWAKTGSTADSGLSPSGSAQDLRREGGKSQGHDSRLG